MSEDLKHDAHIVQNFVNESIKIVKSCKIEIHKIIQFLDQAPSQYKNKSAFKQLVTNGSSNNAEFLWGTAWQRAM